MKKQELLALQKLAGQVGDFIAYWGFRRIHGQIWTVVYLAQMPLSGVEIVEILEVSKALVSPALKELAKEGLIVQAPSENSKTKRYQAEDDVEKIIKNVLRRRESEMLRKIKKSFDDLCAKELDPAEIRSDRMAKLGSMVQMGQLGLTLLLDSDQLLI